MPNQAGEKTTTLSLSTILGGKIENMEISLMASGTQVPLGGGYMETRTHLFKLNWELELTTAPLNRADREALYGFLVYHRSRHLGGAIENFQFSTPPLVRRSSKVLIGFGDGTTTDFYLPLDFWRDFLGQDTLIYVNGVEQTETTDWTHEPGGINDFGAIRFVSAPAADAKIEAKYATEGRFYIVNTEDAIMELRQESEGLYQVRLNLRTFTGRHGAFPEAP